MGGIIYSIDCSKTDKFYIGSTSNTVVRRSYHFTELQKGTHHSIYLQRAYNKYGKENFFFNIIEDVDDILFLRAREQCWINKNKGKLYNMSPCAFSPTGVKRSDEYKEVCRKKMIGNKYRKGKSMPEDFCNNLSKRLKGNSYRKGVKHSEETKKKISDGLKEAYKNGREATIEQAQKASVEYFKNKRKGN